ncbi:MULTISPECIES: hypothetical protein [unclassified Streptomyces]|uniref:hypothetical protein n=1 Tax=unclassified Streptomyces TaxID=2593676 RepID=UPI0022578F54|nr:MULTISPECIES: hypothetical protein [unclassified Streptomyces]MCX4883306.1 hypothetical protein [Streptomyces sp. NBC_00847]MCX5423328.1 hypothetical protein [Streptomyces sp. NBC_00078]
MGGRGEWRGRPYGGDAHADKVPLDAGADTDADARPGLPSERQAGMRPPVRMCVRCHVTTEAPVVVCVVHQNSGPGFTVYACRACAPHFPPPDPADVPTRTGGER